MTVTKHTNGNIGGVNPLQYVFAEDILSFSINPVTLVGSINLKPGCAWSSLYATADTIQCEGKEDLMPGGMKYTYEIKMLIPKDRSDVEISLMLLNYRKMVILLTDKNGVSRYYGTDKIPMRKLSRLVKPSAIEGYNGWEVAFTGSFPAPACYVTLPGAGWVPDPTAGT